jgi:aconitate hydratase
MAPEYGRTCGFFPIDGETLRYLRVTGRDEARIALVEAYAKEQRLWREADYAPIYSSTLTLDMGDGGAGHLGPEAPAGPRPLTEASASFFKVVDEYRRARATKSDVAVAGRTTPSRTARW